MATQKHRTKLALAVGRALRSCGGPAAAVLMLASAVTQADPSFYVGPIFGIATAADGRLLVADSAQGVVDGRTGEVIAVLPGIVDIALIAGSDEMWAITGPTDVLVDSGQALWRIDGNGEATQVANLFAYEAKFNPHPAAVDSNPFDVADLGGDEALVADAGGNTLLKVNKHGKVKLVAVLPDELVSTANAEAILGEDFPPQLPAQPVATSIAIGPDGYFYVGELKGFPAPLNDSGVWRIAPNARNAMCGVSPLCTLALEGLTSIVDLAFGPDGRLYAAQIDDQSWLAVELAAFEGAPIPLGGSVVACNLVTKSCQTVVSDQPVLTTITFRSDGLWGATNSFFPGTDVTRLLP
jgi:hypothetical protein